MPGRLFIQCKIILEEPLTDFTGRRVLEFGAFERSSQTLSESTVPIVPPHQLVSYKLMFLAWAFGWSGPDLGRSE